MSVDLPLSGTWRSRYTYHSDSRGHDLTSEHEVVFRQAGASWLGESTPSEDGSTLTLSLDVEDGVVSGTWREHTSPTGHYQRATYHGVLQLLLDADGETMTGRWLGFGKGPVVNVGDWSFVRDAP